MGLQSRGSLLAVLLLAAQAQATTSTVQLDTYPSSIVVADFDGDGHQDIAALCDDQDTSNDWEIDIARGYGNTSGHVGEFHAVQVRSLALSDATNNLSDLQAGKINNDNDVDLLWLQQNNGGSKIGRNLGNGDGTFGTKTTYNVSDNPTSLVVYDRNPGTDSYADVSYVSQDVPGGSRVDTVGLRCGTSTGGLGSEYTANGNVPVFMRLVDVGSTCNTNCNGHGNAPDGIKDYLFLNAAGNARVIIGANSCADPNGQQYTSSLGISSGVVIEDVQVADVTGDGKVDILIVADGKLWTATGNSNATFNTATSVTVADGAIGLTLADIDGDSDIDALVTDEAFEGGINVVVYPNNGSGTWGSTTTYTVEDDYQPTNTVVKDMDEDGDKDIIVGSGATGLITVFLR